MAAITRVGSIRKHFRKLKDARVQGRCTYTLFDVVVLAICGILGNCDDWPDIAQFATKRIDWFRRFLKLPKGVPAHDTFERVFAALDPDAFERCCLAWLTEASDIVGGHIAIDGKTLRGSGTGKLAPLHMVSAWATQARLVLGLVSVDAKSNEITAIPPLLELLDLKGALVTIDAMGCQKQIADKIVSRGGDYLLIAKGNQEELQADIQQTVARALDGELPRGSVAQHTTREVGHGRQEERSCVVVRHTKGIRSAKAWKKLKTVGMCRRERTVGDRTSTEVCYFISSRRLSAREAARALRSHWGIENNQHWQLDVSFREDASRIENRHGSANFALMRRLALCLHQRHPRKDSIARKRKRAALDPTYLAETLAGAHNLGKI